MGTTAATADVKVATPVDVGGVDNAGAVADGATVATEGVGVATAVDVVGVDNDVVVDAARTVVAAVLPILVTGAAGTTPIVVIPAPEDKSAAATE
jgi:hypothetical protein